MNLQKATAADFKDIKALYNKAFPSNERAPFSFVRRRAAQGIATMLAAMERGELVGFAYTVGCGDLIYLFFFAVVEDKRGRGVGSEILRLLKDYYPGKKIFLAREPLDDTVENALERRKRHDFYLRNSFFDLPCQVREADVIYDLMATNRELDVSLYNTIMKNWAGKFLLYLVKMELIK